MIPFSLTLGEKYIDLISFFTRSIVGKLAEGDKQNEFFPGDVCYEK